jgi:hypothetical protein
MIARAEKKARKAGVDVAFKNAYAQSLPFLKISPWSVCSFQPPPTRLAKNLPHAGE